MIRHGDIADIPSLKKLWQEAFGDEEKFVDSFFERVFCPSYALCAEKEGQAVAVLYMLPCEIADREGNKENACYFYALATKQEYRRQGIMGELIETAKREREEEGCRFFFLIPASDKLADYYAGFGFRPFGKVCTRRENQEDNVRFPSHIEAFCRLWPADEETPEEVCVSAYGSTSAKKLHGLIPM